MSQSSVFQRPTTDANNDRRNDRRNQLGRQRAKG